LELQVITQGEVVPTDTYKDRTGNTIVTVRVR
jgi:hypothetical protein